MLEQVVLYCVFSIINQFSHSEPEYVAIKSFPEHYFKTLTLSVAFICIALVWSWTVS